MDGDMKKSWLLIGLLLLGGALTVAAFVIR